MNANDLNSGALIAGWLRDMGCEPTVLPADPQVNWAFEVTFPAKPSPGMIQLKMTIYNPKPTPRAVVVAARMLPPPESVAAFEELEQDEKTRFWQALRSTLSRENIEFQLEGAPVIHCPAAFRVNVVRYDDGLTLDNFYHSVVAVQSACFDAIAVFAEHLGDIGPAPGGEFAFKKLGVQ